jgi:predicted MFS family arabinose efflux permease
VFWALLVADSPKAFPMSRGVCISIRAEEIETIVGKSTAVVKMEPQSTPWRVIFTTPAWWAVRYHLQCAIDLNTDVFAVQIFAGHFSINWGFYVLLTWIPKFLKNFLKFPIESAGFWAWAPYAAMFVVCIVAGRLADVLITRKVLQTANVRKIFQNVGALCAAASLLVLAFAVHDSEQKWLAVGCLIAATGLSGFALSGYAVNHIDISPEYSGVLMGLSNCIATIPGIVGVYVTGPIVQGTGSWIGVWILAASIYVAGAIIFTIFAKGKVLF